MMGKCRIRSETSSSQSPAFRCFQEAFEVNASRECHSHSHLSILTHGSTLR